MKGIRLEAWLVEASGGDLRVSPNLTEKILLWGRGGQEVEGPSQRKTRSGSAHASLTVLMEIAVPCMTPRVPRVPWRMAAKLPRINPICWTRIP